MLRLVFCLAVVGCLGSDDKGVEEPLPDDLSADSFRSPTDHGAIGFGEPELGHLTQTERYHAWTFELSAPAKVTMTTSYAVLGQRRVDTVLYLYQHGPNGWGSYRARNDDYGNTTYSQLVRELPAGRYRALVKGYASTTVGRFKLTVGCAGEGCAPACLFGPTLQTWFADPAFHGMGFTRLESAAGLPPETAAQILAAGRIVDPAFADAAAVIARNGFVERHQLVRAATGTQYAVVTLPTAGSVGGAVFRGDTTEIVAEVATGAFATCSVLRAPGGAQIGEDCGTCGDGLSCLGNEGGTGTCIPDEEPAGAGADCTSDASCPSDELVCGGLGNEPRDGICVPTYLRKRFDDYAVTPIVGGSSTRQITAYGLATVAMDIAIAAELANVVPSQIVVRLAQPGGSESIVFDGPALLPDNPDLDSDNFIEIIQYVDGVPGDESANGAYTLIVEDRSGAPGGEVTDWHLTITSRFD